MKDWYWYESHLLRCFGAFKREPTAQAMEDLVDAAQAYQEEYNKLEDLV